MKTHSIRKLMDGLIGIAMITMWILGTVEAQVPAKINYQGYLKNISGNPVNGPVLMRFALYDVITGGTALWSETQTVSVENGIYNVVLAQHVPLNLTEPRPYYLGVSVGSDAEMSPRQEFTSVPYALFAAHPDNDWTLSEGNMYAKLPGSVYLYDDDITLPFVTDSFQKFRIHHRYNGEVPIPYGLGEVVGNQTELLVRPADPNIPGNVQKFIASRSLVGISSEAQYGARVVEAIVGEAGNGAPKNVLVQAIQGLRLFASNSGNATSATGATIQTMNRGILQEMYGIWNGNIIEPGSSDVDLNIGVATGLLFQAENASLNTNYGVKITGVRVDSSTSRVRNNYGIHIGGPAPSAMAGAIERNYGLYIADPENPNIGTLQNFAIYTAGDTPTYFGGKIGIGTETPHSSLQIENGYLQLATVTGNPPNADCDEASERGRMQIDPVSETLWICVNSGWVAK